MFIIYRNFFWFTNAFQTDSPAKWINKQIKTLRVYISVEKGRIDRMLSGQWLITKWIKRVNAQVGSAQPSGWNVKINSQLKVFFQPIMKFPRKVSQSRFDPKHVYKTGNICPPGAVDNRDCSQIISSCITFRTRSKTADVIPTHITINTPNN